MWASLSGLFVPFITRHVNHRLRVTADSLPVARSDGNFYSRIFGNLTCPQKFNALVLQWNLSG